VDLVTGVEGVEVLGLVEIPEHGGSVLATGGAERSVWGDGDGVDVAGVADVVGLETAGRELPNLDELVPTTRNDDWVLWVWAEADAGNPLGVSLFSDGELAVTEGVPQLDGAISGAGNSLSVVGGEGDGENVVCVANKATGGGSGGELPEAESLIPGGGESVRTIGGDNAVGNDVGVAVRERFGYP